MTLQSIVAPIGLITQPNEYGQYKRGALSVAKNVCMRAPGVISSLPELNFDDFYSWGNTTPNRIIRAMCPGDTLMLAFRESLDTTTYELQWTSFFSPYTSVSTPGGLVEAWSGTLKPGCARMVRMRDRWFVAAYEPFGQQPATGYIRGVVVLDSEGATSARNAGITAPAILDQSIYSALGGPLYASSAAAWRVVFRRVMSDGYEIVSAPSVRMVVKNKETYDVAIRIAVALPYGFTVKAGDICEVYRTAVVAGTDTDPGDTMFLAVSQVVTSSDISAYLVTVLDTCPDGALGVALYTNQGQGGAESANYAPPHGPDLAPFKGHMFYTAFETPAQATVSPLIALGNLSTDHERTYGIGKRVINGTWSNGSNIVTAVDNIRGIVVGQKLYDAAGRMNGGGGSRITAVTATTITCSHNSVGSGSGTADVFDQLRYSQGNFVSDVSADDPWYLTRAGASGAFSSLIWQSSKWADYQDATTAGTSSWSKSTPSPGMKTRGASAIAMLSHVYDQSFTLRATNGVNYSPPLPEYGSTANTYSPQIRKNRYAWSKFQQPEHVPSLNFAFVGAGELLRMIPTRDALWLFCTDGLHRLSGNGGDGADAWREDMADPNLVLAARNAVCTLKETVWCYTNRGLVAISDDGGIQEISLGVIGDRLPGSGFGDTWDTFMVADEAHNEVRLSFRLGTIGAGSTITYVFNTLTKTFVTFDDGREYSLSAYMPSLYSVVLARVGAGSPTPDAPYMYYFQISTNDRVPGAQVSFQPLYAADPFTLKQYSTVTMVFDGVAATATLTPTFDVNGAGIVDSTSFAMKQSVGMTRETIGVPRRAAIAPDLRPGFKMSNVAAPWTFKGVTARFTPGGEETSRA